MLICGDALTELKKLEPNSVSLILTDPPYFLDKLDSSWTPNSLNFTTKNQHVTSLPGGMKYSRNQGYDLYKWLKPICEELYRVVKPGAFFFCFSAPRLYHRMACAIEDSGFNIRDCFMWLYTHSQPKAMSVTRFDSSIPSNWKTPQVKSCFEPIVVAQKPPEGTLYENFTKHGVGLINTNARLGDNMFPANCIATDDFDETISKYFLVGKPKKEEFNTHKTVKPLSICEHLISLTTQEGQVVLDCFVGSGSTVVAAKKLGRDFIGIDVNQEYLEIVERRLTFMSDLSIHNK